MIFELVQILYTASAASITSSRRVGKDSSELPASHNRSPRRLATRSINFYTLELDKSRDGAVQDPRIPYSMCCYVDLLKAVRLSTSSIYPGCFWVSWRASNAEYKWRISIVTWGAIDMLVCRLIYPCFVGSRVIFQIRRCESLVLDPSTIQCAVHTQADQRVNPDTWRWTLRRPRAYSPCFVCLN